MCLMTLQYRGSGDSRIVKIADFGLSRCVDEYVQSEPVLPTERRKIYKYRHTLNKGILDKPLSERWNIPAAIFPPM